MHGGSAVSAGAAACPRLTPRRGPPTQAGARPRRSGRLRGAGMWARPSQSARSPPPARTATARPPRAHGRGLLGPYLPALGPPLRHRVAAVPAAGPAASAPAPSGRSKWERSNLRTPGAGRAGRDGGARGREQGKRKHAGMCGAEPRPDAIGGPTDQWQR